MIYYSVEDIQEKYPGDVKTALAQQQATILVQGIYADLESAKLSAQEQIFLRTLEETTELTVPPVCMKDFKIVKKNLVTVIRARTADQIAFECRTHIRHTSDNNTFIWSGPSGVLAATDNGPKGRYTGFSFRHTSG
jgi:hypothetical protein